MARRSKTRDDIPRAVAAGSPARPGSPSPTARRGSKGAAVAKWLRRIISTVVVLAVLVAVGVVSVVLIQGTWQVNPVLSGSMRPGFSVGGVVISERIPVDKLVLRNVMVFASPDDPAKLIVHRIVLLSKSKSGQLVIRTQGDANNVRDPWTLTIKGHYAYVVRWSLPLLGYVAIAYQNNHGLVLLGAGIVLIAAAAATILKQRRRGEEPDASEDSESSGSLDNEAASLTGPAEDVNVTPSATEFDARPMESTASFGESHPPWSLASEAATPISEVTVASGTAESEVDSTESASESELPLSLAPEPETPVTEVEETTVTPGPAESEADSTESASESQAPLSYASDPANPISEVEETTVTPSATEFDARPMESTAASFGESHLPWSLASDPATPISEVTVTPGTAESEADSTESASESQAPLSYASDPANPISEVEETTVTPGPAESEADSMETSPPSAGESELLQDSPLPQKTSWKRRFGMKED